LISLRIIFRYAAMQNVVDFALETPRDRSPDPATSIPASIATVTRSF
jgi:hypothetical protein